MTQYTDFVNGRILGQMVENGNFRQLAITLNESFFDFCGIMDEIYDAFEIETAVGDQLDKIGGFVGLPRSGFNDADYRRNINIQISIIRSKIQRIDGLLGNWNGTVTNILSIARSYIGEAIPQKIILTQIPPYSFEIQIPGDLELAEVTQLFQFVKRALYAGVLGYTIFLLGENNLWSLGGYEDGIEVYSANASGSLYSDVTAEFIIDDGTLDFLPFEEEFAVSASCAFGYESPFTELSLVRSSSFVQSNAQVGSQWWDGGNWENLNPIYEPNVLSGSDRIVTTSTWDIPANWPKISFPPQKFADGVSSSVLLYDGTTTQSVVANFYNSSSNCQLFNTDTTPAVVGNYGQLLLKDLVFGGIFFDFSEGTIGTDGEVSWEYWNGSIWTALPNVVDQTNHFKAGLYTEQIVSWDIPNDWATINPGTGPIGYPVRWIVTTNYAISPEILQASVWNVQDGDYKNWMRFKITSGSLPLTNNPEMFYGFYGNDEQSLQGYWIENAIADEAHWAIAEALLTIWQVSTSSTQFFVQGNVQEFLNTGFEPFDPSFGGFGSYIMFGSSEPIESINLNIDTAGTDGSVVWEFSTGAGTGWNAFLNVNDQTNAFRDIGPGKDVTWSMPAGWNKIIESGLSSTPGFNGKVFTLFPGFSAEVDVTDTFFNDSLNNVFWGGEGIDPGGMHFIIDYDCPFAGAVYDFAGGTLATGTGSISWEYWNGAAWTVLPNVQDQTQMFKAGTYAKQGVTWDIPEDWDIHPATGALNLGGPGYAIRAILEEGAGFTGRPITSGSNYIYNRQNVEPMYYARARSLGAYTIFPEGSSGSISPMIGEWMEGSINDEGIWSLALSTNFPAISEKNDNDPF